MKHLVSLLLLLLCCSIGTVAQNWATFPLDESSQWLVHRWHLTPATCAVYEDLVFELSSDTVFNGETYQVIRYHGTYWSQETFGNNPSCNVYPPLPTSGVRGYLRAEDGIYYEGNPQGEWPIYDMTLEVGDTMNNNLTDFDDYIVDSVDQVLISGQPRKRIFFENADAVLIDGVGSNYALLDLLSNFEAGSNLMCYGENGIPLYPEASNCDFTVGQREWEAESISISPNPSTGVFRIESTQESSYRIFDLFGRLVQAGQLHGASEIDISSESNGIYLITVKAEKGVRSEKLVKQ